MRGEVSASADVSRLGLMPSQVFHTIFYRYKNCSLVYVVNVSILCKVINYTFLYLNLPLGSN